MKLLTPIVGCLLAIYPWAILYSNKVYFVILGTTICFMICSDLVRNHSKLIDTVKTAKWFIGIQVLFLISLTWATKSTYNLKNVSAMFFSVAMVLLVQYALSRLTYESIMTVRYFINIIIVSLFISALFLLIIFGNIRGLTAEQKAVVGSYANVSVGISLCAIMYSWYFYKYNRSLHYLVIIALSALTILISMSRVGIFLLSCALLFGVFFLSSQKKMVLRKLVKYVFCMAGFMTVLVFSSDYVREQALFTISRFKGIEKVRLGEIVSGEVDSFDSNEPNLRRKQHLSLAVQLIKEKPYIGIGYDNFPYYFEEMYGVKKTVHNMFLRTWCEVGIIGVILLILMFYNVFKGLFVIRDNCLKRGYFYVADFYLTTMFLLVLMILQGQFRGMFGDLAFLVVLGIAFSSTTKSQVRAAKRVDLKADSGIRRCVGVR